MSAFLYSGWRPIAEAPVDRPFLGYEDGECAVGVIRLGWGGSRVFDPLHQNSITRPTHWIDLPSPPVPGLDRERSAPMCGITQNGDEP